MRRLAAKPQGKADSGAATAGQHQAAAGLYQAREAGSCATEPQSRQAVRHIKPGWVDLDTGQGLGPSSVSMGAN